jgi:hypothetical protein
MKDILSWLSQNFVGLVVAIATVVLVYITKRYVDLTHSLVQVQVDPGLEVGVEDEPGEKPRLILHNSGAEPIVNIHVQTHHYIFQDLAKGPISAQSSTPRIVSESEKRSWWDVDTLEVDEIQGKEATEVVERCLQNTKAMEQMVLNGLFHDSEGKPIKPKKVGLFSFLIFDIKFTRKVDRKSYRVLKTTALVPSQDSGKVVLYDTEILRAFGEIGLEQAIDFINRRLSSQDMQSHADH